MCLSLSLSLSLTRGPYTNAQKGPADFHSLRQFFLLSPTHSKVGKATMPEPCEDAPFVCPCGKQRGLSWEGLRKFAAKKGLPPGKLPKRFQLPRRCSECGTKAVFHGMTTHAGWIRYRIYFTSRESGESFTGMCIFRSVLSPLAPPPAAPKAGLRLLPSETQETQA